MNFAPSIFVMASLVEDLVSTLKSCPSNWKQYVDHLNANAESAKVKFISDKLNNYHPNINFTFELEKTLKKLFRRICQKSK